MATPSRAITLPPLRPYQAQLVESAWQSLRTKQRTLAVSPTATGKTVCMLHMAAVPVSQGSRVLMIVPAHLVGQTAERVREAKIRCDIEKGSKYAETWADCVVASIDTLASGNRLERWDEEHFALVLVDEAHHSNAPTWARVVSHFTMAKVVGFTATPDRADCKKLLAPEGLFHDVCFEYTIQEAVGDGWLCPIDQRFVRIEGLDFSQIRKEAQDLHNGDVEALVNNATMIKLMGDATIKLCGDRPSIVFCTSVAHAHAYAEYLRHAGATAVAVDGFTKKLERVAAELDFRTGKVQYLCNVDCLSEGWDAPIVSAVVQARATLSRALYAQQIGRGLRLYPNKSNCLVVDFVGNSGQHVLVHAAHVLDPNISDRVAKRASELQEANEDLSVTEAIQLAFAECADEDAQTKLRKAVTEGDRIDATYESVSVDPFRDSDTSRVFEILGLDRVEDRWGRMASDAQCEALRRFGVKDPEVMSHSEATRMLETLYQRARAGKATIKQIRKLIAAGTLPSNAAAMSFARASQGITELAQNNWRRPPSWGPRARSSSSHS